MRKMLLRAFIAMTLMLSVAQVGTAQAASAQTLITGRVLDGGVPLLGATVIASCGRYFADTDVTDATGAYLTSFPATECGPLSDVELVAVLNNNFGTARGMTYRVTGKLNIANTTVFMR